MDWRVATAQRDSRNGTAQTRELPATREALPRFGTTPTVRRSSGKVGHYQPLVGAFTQGTGVDLHGARALRGVESAVRTVDSAGEYGSELGRWRRAHGPLR